MKYNLHTLSATAFLALMGAGEAFAASGGHGHEETGSAGLPQLDPTWFASQIFWLTLTFVALYVLFANRVLPDITKTLEGRSEHIQGDLDMARDLQEEAQKVHDEYEAVLAEARQKASKLYAEIDKDIKEKTATEYAEFQDRILKDTHVAEARIAKAKKEIMDDVDSVMVKISLDAVSKITGVEPKDAKAKAVIEKLHNKAA